MKRPTPYDHNAYRRIGWLESQRPYLGVYVWVLQGWMAMFFLGAAFIKITTAMELLVILMTWPRWIGPDIVRAIGYVEGVLAVGLLVPAVNARWGWSIVRIAAVLLSANAALMIGLYIVLRDVGMVATNLALLAIGLGIVMGRRPRAAAAPSSMSAAR